MPENQSKLLRGVSGFINWILFIPIFLLTSYFSLYVFIDYIKNGFKFQIRYLFLTIPFLIYLIYYAGRFIYIIFII